ncbi:hypothetical protein JHK87_015892 [Glycine soja]|nr:hypothetical protein JHK87_015892 [Glycine soja]
MKTLIYNVLTGRWFMLFASLLIMAAAGAAYMSVEIEGNMEDVEEANRATIESCH